MEADVRVVPDDEVLVDVDEDVQLQSLSDDELPASETYLTLFNTSTRWRGPNCFNTIALIKSTICF